MKKRRGFLKKLAVGILGLQIGYLFWDSIKKENKKDVDASWFDAGRFSDLEINKIYPFQTGGFFLSVLEDKGLMAFSVNCTHLACVLHIKDSGFICPCHASKFNQYGEVLSSPATRPMDLFQVKISSDKILVNNQEIIKRKAFEPSQIYYS
mgnify:CR=1 FL=1